MISYRGISQLELKANPVALLFNAYGLSAEYNNLKYWGGQADVYIFDATPVAFLIGKYYLNPKIGADRFHIGVFASYIEDFGVGFMLGYKLVSNQKVIFELGGGIGRALSELEAIPYLNFNIGYRFYTKPHMKME